MAIGVKEEREVHQDAQQRAHSKERGCTVSLHFLQEHAAIQPRAHGMCFHMAFFLYAGPAHLQQLPLSLNAPKDLPQVRAQVLDVVVAHSEPYFCERRAHFSVRGLDFFGTSCVPTKAGG